MHWSEVFVSDLNGNQVVSTGISPSGPIHVGNMREILTGHILYREAQRRGLESRFIYLADDMDPLRKLYPFLPKEYENYVGMPLYKIPSPTDDVTYSECYLKPFLGVLGELGIKVDVIRSHTLYADGRFADVIDLVISRRKKVAEILTRISGRELEPNWFPYSPVCSKCGKLSGTVVTEYEKPYVSYTCSCGNQSRSNINNDEGKLPWRIEWPAKWLVLGVTVEPFGKDHGSPGGSYDTGAAISREIFGVDPPKPLTYEWITLKGKGTMHSSTGVSIAASDFVKLAPPEILRFLIARNQPGRHIEFDPAVGLLNLVDEFEKLGEGYASNSIEPDSRKIFEISTDGISVESLMVGFRHLITLVQIYPEEDKLALALKRSGYKLDKLTPGLEEKVSMAKNWIDTYAPDQMRFSLLPVDSPCSLDSAGKEVLSAFGKAAISMEWTPDAIHNSVHSIIKNAGLNPVDGFRLFYLAFIGKERGPRLGYFLSNLDRKFVLYRIENVVSG